MPEKELIYVDGIVKCASFFDRYFSKIKNEYFKFLDAKSDGATQKESISLIHKLSKLSASLIEHAIHFSLEDKFALLKLLPREESIEELWGLSNHKNLRLPYPIMTLSFFSDIASLDEDEEDDTVAEKGMPCMFVIEEESVDLIWVITWTRMNQYNSFSAFKNYGDLILPNEKWIPPCQPFLLSLSGKFSSRPDVEEIGERLYNNKDFLKDFDDICVCPTVNEYTSTEMEIDLDIHLVLIPYLIALNTKGLVTHTIRPPKKREKKNRKFPTVEYKVLKIGGTHSVSTFATQPTITDAKRLHLCRGHIKTYTAEKPLLGKAVGSFFFSSHIRGDENKGILLKDYVYTDSKRKNKSDHSMPGALPTPNDHSMPEALPTPKEITKNSFINRGMSIVSKWVRNIFN